MIRKTKAFYFAFVVVGVILLAAGFIAEYLEVKRNIFAFASGFGCGWIAVGFINLYLYKNKPERAKQLEINQKDERNIRIREKSGYIAFFVTLLALTIIEFVLLFFENEFGCILIIGVMMIHITSFLVSASLYNKKL